jgi:hypothetical protein
MDLVNFFSMLDQLYIYVIPWSLHLTLGIFIIVFLHLSLGTWSMSSSLILVIYFKSVSVANTLLILLNEIE